LFQVIDLSANIGSQCDGGERLRFRVRLALPELLTFSYGAPRIASSDAADGEGRPWSPLV